MPKHQLAAGIAIHVSEAQAGKEVLRAPAQEAADDLHRKGHIISPAPKSYSSGNQPNYWSVSTVASRSPDMFSLWAFVFSVVVALAITQPCKLTSAVRPHTMGQATIENNVAAARTLKQSASNVVWMYPQCGSPSSPAGPLPYSECVDCLNHAAPNQKRSATS
eukprot:gene9130-16253_t